MNSIIESFKVTLNNTESVPIDGILNDNEKFGILQMKMKSTKLITEPALYFLFTLDITGSMGERGGKEDHSKTKLDDLKSTMCSLVKFLATRGSPIFIKINIFNADCMTLQDTIRITESNYQNITLKINTLQPDGSTDIGKALRRAVEDINAYHTSNGNKEHILGHIFLSDGEPTAGELNFDKLANLIDTSYPNIFLGFGLTHNASLFQLFASKPLAEYRFIDNCELSSLVYGEVLNRFLYPAVSNAKINIVNGEIYNYKTNKWTTTINEDNIATEVERTYHVKTKTPDVLSLELRGQVTGVPEDSMDDYENLSKEVKLLATTTLVDDDNLIKYIFRQKVQELLYHAKEFNQKRNPNNDEKKQLVTDMKDLFKRMKSYMTENGLEDDAFFTLLCDDIHITYTTLDTPVASMYSASRHFGQGNQNSYCSASPQLQRFGFGQNTVCQSPFPFKQNNVLRFGFRSGNQEPTDDQLNNVEKDELDLYKPSKNTNSCYSTPSVVRTMTALTTKNDF